MNSFNQRSFDYDNRMSFNGTEDFNKSDKFQEAVCDMRLIIWKKFLLGVASNPNMTKKEVCHHMCLKVGTINSIQHHYKLQSPFYYSKPKKHLKKKQQSVESKMIPSVESKVNEEPPKKSKVKKRPEDLTEIKGGNTYDFEKTFSEAVNSLQIS